MEVTFSVAFVCLSVCLSVCKQHYSNSYEEIAVKVNGSNFLNLGVATETSD